MRGTRLARHHGAAYPSFDPAGVLELLVIVLLLVALSACRTAPASSAAPAPVRPEGVAPSGAERDTTCELALGPVQSAETLTVALPGPVDPAHAPVPQTEAERIVFAQLYEPLVHIDCVGRVVPGLAESWIVDSGGRRWTFTLRHDAQFWDGVPVTAQEVIAGWRWRDPLRVSPAIALGPRELRVSFPDSTFVPGLAGMLPLVTKPSPDRGWPIGTGRYWVSGSTVTGMLLAQPLSGAAPAIAFRDVTGSDPRDILDQGVDLLLTDDPTVVSYAVARRGLTALPLAWDRRYILAVQFEPGPGIDHRDLAGAVHAEARADSGAACAPSGAGDATGQPALPPRRLVYDRTDRTARELAERLVARRVLGADVPAWGLAPADFAAALRTNTAWAYVSVAPTTLACANIARESHVQALIEIRRFAIVRRGIPRLLLDADGTVRLMPR